MVANLASGVLQEAQGCLTVRFLTDYLLSGPRQGLFPSGMDLGVVEEGDAILSPLGPDNFIHGHHVTEPEDG